MPQMRIKKIAEQVAAAQSLLNEIRIISDPEASIGEADGADSRPSTPLEAAIWIYERRRARSRHFPDPDLFGEPAWDILLDLFIHQARHEKTTVKSACIGSGVPSTTALRWLKLLERDKLLSISDDPTDQRRRLVALTPLGFDSMTHYLEGAIKTPPSAKKR